MSTNLDNFSNNLVTDLGPLLALFGDDMTKQYLSECTSIADYIIFAVGPIGILTAIFSAIRVCGSTTLRAFIGKAQEGPGAVEAELCTSTSKDVCEVFNAGGITRVLGQPKILELVRVHQSDPNKADMGLHLFRQHLPTLCAKGKGTKEGEWIDLQKRGDEDAGKPNMKRDDEEAGKPNMKRDDKEAGKPNTERDDEYSQNPNLSLNVGIYKPPLWVFRLVAGFGLTLQIGIAVFGGLAPSYLPSNGTSTSSVSKLYSRIIFVSGTFLMCFGTGLCAALIGHRTNESYYQRRRPRDVNNSSLLWLQPGNQLVGGQTFGAYAYFEGNDRLKLYTTSRMDMNARFEGTTAVVAFFTLTGYVAQFIGLRGLPSTVSLAQLLLMILMSIIRGSLRMQRIKSYENWLEEFGDAAVGHELDWLAFKLLSDDDQPKHEPLNSCHFTGYHEGIRVSESTTSSLSSSLASRYKSLNTLSGRLEKLIRIRARLAHLTGHMPLNDPEKLICQTWEDDRVTVRKRARQLASALGSAAAALIGNKGKVGQAISLLIGIGNHLSPSRLGEMQTVELTLQRPDEFTPMSWKIDSACLEAILSLWHWSMIYEHRGRVAGACDRWVANRRKARDHDNAKQSKARFLQNAKHLAEIIPKARIICTGDRNARSGFQTYAQAEVDFWLGSSTATLAMTHLELAKNEECGLITRWTKRNDDDNPDKIWWSLAQDTEESVQRFFNWNTVYASLQGATAGAREIGEKASSGTSTQDKQVAEHISIQFVMATNSLVDVCCQELYSAALASMSSLSVDLVMSKAENSEPLRFVNEKIAAMERAFTDNKLGSPVDAILCIVPVLQNKLKPDFVTILPTLFREATKHRQRREWNPAEKMLRWAFLRTAPRGKEILEESAPFLRATYEIAEFSRCEAASSDPDEVRIGSWWIPWLESLPWLDTAPQDCPVRQKIKQIMGTYKDVLDLIGGHWRNTKSISSLNESEDEAQPSEAQAFLKMVESKRRAEALYQLSFLNKESEIIQPALPMAARHQWNEIVRILLEIKVDSNSTDDADRTALSYAAEFGDLGLARELMDHKADPYQFVKSDQPVYFWAMRTPDPDTTDQLLGLFLEVSPFPSAFENVHTAKANFLLWAAEDGDLHDVEFVTRGLKPNYDPVDFNRRTPMALAAAKGNYDIVEALLNGGADRDWVDGTGRTPLLWALTKYEDQFPRMMQRNVNLFPKDERKRERESVALLLIRRWVELTVADRLGRTALSLAAENGFAEAVEEIIITPYIKINSKDERYNRTPLAWAIIGQHENIAISLLQHQDIDPDSNDIEGRTPLSLAAEHGLEEVVKEILAKPNINLESIDKENGWTPLAWAIVTRQESIAISLLRRQGVNPDFNDKEDRTPLSLAAEHGLEEVVKEILAKPNINLESADRKNRWTPLWWAVQSTGENIVKMLLYKGAKPDSRDADGNTPLCFAAGMGCDQVVNLLLGSGADPNIMDSDGSTPLSSACAQNCRNIVKTLLAIPGIDANSKNKDGSSPLSRAAAIGRTEIVKTLLVVDKILVDDPNKRGYTPFFLAVSKNHPDIVEALLKDGRADPNWKNNEGNTPLGIAIQKWDNELVKLLLAAGENRVDVNLAAAGGRLPLTLAKETGNQEIIELLQKAGARDAMTEDGGNSNDSERQRGEGGDQFLADFDE